MRSKNFDTPSFSVVNRLIKQVVGKKILKIHKFTAKIYKFTSEFTRIVTLLERIVFHGVGLHTPN